MIDCRTIQADARYVICDQKTWTQVHKNQVENEWWPKWAKAEPKVCWFYSKMALVSKKVVAIFILVKASSFTCSSWSGIQSRDHTNNNHRRCHWSHSIAVWKYLFNFKFLIIYQETERCWKLGGFKTTTFKFRIKCTYFITPSATTFLINIFLLFAYFIAINFCTVPIHIICFYSFQFPNRLMYLRINGTNIIYLEKVRSTLIVTFLAWTTLKHREELFFVKLLYKNVGLSNQSHSQNVSLPILIQSLDVIIFAMSKVHVYVNWPKYFMQDFRVRSLLH